MSRQTALLTFGIGPVHSFIAQARRVADVWAGSHLLSHLIRQAVRVLRDETAGEEGCGMLFPFLRPGDAIPDGLPNRLVCRVPAEQASAVARRMEKEVQAAWDGVVKAAVRNVLKDLGLSPASDLWSEVPAAGAPRQTDALLDFAWSWVPEEQGYAEASLAGARRFAAARLYRPFPPTTSNGEKCAVCGERTALPNGARDRVQTAWAEAAESSRDTPLEKYFRLDQGRLCLVCAAKRLYTYSEGHQARFEAFDRFQPSDEAPYFALVKMDGDRMGSILSLEKERIESADLEAFHKAVSRSLLDFAGELRIDKSVDLNTAAIDYQPRGMVPQLIYAGGDDVLLVCDPRDALPLVRKLRQRYVRAFEETRRFLRDPADRGRFTISAAVLFAHPGHPAGLLLRDLETLLKVGAKARAGRNAVAVRLMKRAGVPEEVAFAWDDADAPAGDWIASLDQITERLRTGQVSSRQSFTLRLEERTLQDAFAGDLDRWTRWLQDRLSRSEAASRQAEELAAAVAPFFLHGHAPALRIARFLGREVER